MTDWPFAHLKKNHYGVIYLDPPWAFKCWNGDKLPSRVADAHYQTMTFTALEALPVGDLAAENCILICWVVWPTLPEALSLIKHWGFEYKTCAFSWMKANNKQMDMFSEDSAVQVGMGYWTRANSEVALLAVRGSPKRLNADVRQGIISPRREHSRKPEGMHERIERLAAGPFCELFARQSDRKKWDFWGNETEKFANING
jgi:N6-adenosine-specific RNA methylase IME4